MDIQKYEASLKGLKMSAKFVNISKSEELMDREFSPIIETDQQRLIQVLLKL